MEEFLFSSVDKKYWLMVTKKDLIGEDGFKTYANEWINVIASSSNCEPHQGNHILHSFCKIPLINNNHLLVVMLNRGGNWFTDPYVSIGRFPHGVVYAEDSTEGSNQLLTNYGGMDVFIKKKISIPGK